ncbi:hypothetical protein ACTGJ9_033235 [Bradyrhizobium sp. RDM12]
MVDTDDVLDGHCDFLGNCKLTLDGPRPLVLSTPDGRSSHFQIGGEAEFHSAKSLIDAKGDGVSDPAR